MTRNRGVGLIMAAALLFAACQGQATTPPGGLTGCIVGVSWNNFQQPRWASTDRPSMQKVIRDGGGVFIDFDANLDSVQQLTDVETLINQGAKVLVLLAQNQQAVLPALEKAKAAKIPVIAYDRLIEDPSVLYITFNNVDVGKAEAAALFAKVPKGNYVVIKGDPGDPNAASFLPQGFDEAGLKDKVASGDITIVAEQFTDAWATQKAQNNMEAIIDKANADGVKIHAVLAENDSTALGVVAAIQSKGYDIIPVSGQDGDHANLNNVAKGLQYVDVWKNSNELGKTAGAAALQLCEGKAIADIELPAGVVGDAYKPLAGNKPADFKTPGPDGKNGTGDENTVKSFILQVTPVTAETLNLPLDAGWIKKADLCKGVDAATAPAACK